MRLFLYTCGIAIVIGLIPTFVQNTIRAEVSDPAPSATPSTQAVKPPPSRVGRLSLVTGDVDLRGVGETSWADAALNQPVIAGQAVRTGRKARGEIEIGAHTVDVSNDTELEIARLDDQTIQLSVRRGRMGLRLRQFGDGETVGIDFPQGAVWLLNPGRYDVDAGDDDRPARVAVFEGTVRLIADGTETRVEMGQVAVLSGSAPLAVAGEPAKQDDFVEWCRDCDYDETRLAARYYVSPYVTGIAELDAAGVWKMNADYGPVWFPSDPEWSPYRFGHWSWMAPWGWTWIDDQPWGFAPSHYGRWALIDEHWGWVPGSFAAHPLFAPAVVAFLGTPGVGLSSEDGPTVAWFPLAPGEAYWPTYSRDVDYVRRLNTANVEDVATIGMQPNGEPPLELFREDFANRELASVVPRSVFVNGRPVAPARVTLPEQRLQNAPVLMASPQIAPPLAQPVARAVATTVKPAAARAAVKASRKDGAKITRATSIKPRGREQPTVIRAAHLYAPSYAGQSRLRQLIVLRVARNPHGAVRKRARH
jgi:hypothetical protein